MRVATLTCMLLISTLVCNALTGTFFYKKQPMPRDLTLELAHLYKDVYWRCDPDNVYSEIENGVCPITSPGWRARVPYCWAGSDEIYEFLTKMTEGLGAGDSYTRSSGPNASDPWHARLVGGVDCSGYVSQCFRSGRYSTSSFHNVTTDIGWENLAPGDAINRAGSHIRLCEKYPTDTGLIQVYESTGSSGPWQVIRRVLSIDNRYAGVRYHHASPFPSIIDASWTAPGQVAIAWLGAASTGFRVYGSIDGTAWSVLQNESTLDEDEDTAIISGLVANQLYMFKVTAINEGSESGPSNVFPLRLPEVGRPAVLLVHGYDRWLRQRGGTGFHSLLARYGIAFDALGISFETCDNLRVTRNDIDLNNYAAVVWMLGDEAYHDHTLNFLEIARLQSYLQGGGNLFISGTNLGWDLVAHEAANDNLEVDDSVFYEYFLRTKQTSNGANGYSVDGEVGSIFEGLAITYDDGSHGSYNVTQSDRLQPFYGGVSCLKYPIIELSAGVQYKGAAPDSGNQCTLVNLAVPFETIYPQETRREVMERVMGFFDVLPTPTPAGAADIWVDGREDAVDLLHFANFWQQQVSSVKANETRFADRADIDKSGTVDSADLLQLIKLLQ
jgi:hypothetical protein